MLKRIKKNLASKRFNDSTIQRFNDGQSLIEVLIALGLASLLLPAILTGLVASREGKAQEDQRLHATALLRDAQEITRNVRERGWANIATNGTYHPGAMFYKSSICQRPLPGNSCPAEYDTFVGPSNSSGQFLANFSYTNPQAGFAVWAAKDPITTGCSGIACFAGVTPHISNMTIANLLAGVTYDVAICLFQSNNCATELAKDTQAADASGNLLVSFSYAPQIAVEVFVAKNPAATGCSGLACFAGVNPLVRQITFSGLDTGTNWNLALGNETIDGFMRKIEISDTRRDPTTGNIVTSGGHIDPSTKKIKTTVSWSTPYTSQVDSTIYLSRFLNNTAWLQTTQADFNAGTQNNTATSNGGTGTPGAVELFQTPTSTGDYGNKFRVESPTSSVGSMNTTGHKTSLRFTAQATKIVNGIRVYIHTKSGSTLNWRFGIQSNAAGDVPSGTWVGSPVVSQVTTGNTWKQVTLTTPASLTQGNTYHIVIEPYAPPNPTASNNIALRRSTPLNNLIPLTNTQDSKVNTLFKTSAAGSWSAQNFQPIYELDFNDSTYEGNPYDTSTAVNIFGSNYFGEKFTVAGGAKTAQSISFYLRRQGSPPSNLTVEIRDSTNNPLPGSSGTIATTSASTSFTYLTYTFASPITLTNGSTYRVILRTTGGNSSNRYQVYRIDNTPNLANYNSITYDGTNSIYTSSSNAGGTWSDTGPSPAINQDIGGFYFTVTNPASYPTQGDFTSQTFDAGANSAFNNITWTASTPPTTTLKLQVAINNDNATWNYFGPNGIGDFYTSPGQIPINTFAQLAMNLNYTALGDSITTGFYAGSGGGYVPKYKNYINTDLNANTTITNLGVPGWTSTDLLNAVQNDQAYRNSISNANIITIFIGINDFYYQRLSYLDNTCGGSDNQDCLRNMVSTYQTNLASTISEIKSLNPRPNLLVRLAEIYYPTQGNPTAQPYYTVLNSYIRQMNQYVHVLSAQNNYKVAALYVAFNGINGDEDPFAKGYFIADGIHTNNLGNTIIANEFRNLGYDPLNSSRYVRFKAILSGNGTTTPTLSDVTINYSP